MTAQIATPPEARALAAITALGLPGDDGAAFAKSDGFRLWGPAAATVKLDDAAVRGGARRDQFSVLSGDERTTLRVSVLAIVLRCKRRTAISPRVRCAMA